jgi:hypothetical protein
MGERLTLDALLDHAGFRRRHLGLTDDDRAVMLSALGRPDLDTLVADVVPAAIRSDGPSALGSGATEVEVIAALRRIAERNEVVTSLIGCGYADTVTPPVIARNVLENPSWYTAYTPYQPEIAQGRLEALLNFQTMVADLTGLDVANASMLDEGTAAAEAMTLCRRAATSPSYAPGPNRSVSTWSWAIPTAIPPSRRRSVCWCSIPVRVGRSVIRHRSSRPSTPPVVSSSWPPICWP